MDADINKLLCIKERHIASAWLAVWQSDDAKEVFDLNTPHQLYFHMFLTLPTPNWLQVGGAESDSIWASAVTAYSFMMFIVSCNVVNCIPADWAPLPC